MLVRNRFEGYSDGVQINGGNRNYIAGNIFIHNTFGLSLSGTGNIIDGNTIVANAVGIAVRPAAPMTLARISRNLIAGNGQAIERCFAGGSCDPNLRKGGIVFGLPSGEHASYVGKRGIGVNPAPASLAKICPDGAPGCQDAAERRPRCPVIESVRRSGTQFADARPARSEPRARLSGRDVRQHGSRTAAKAKYFLGETVAVSDADGNGPLPRDGGWRQPRRPCPGPFTATLNVGRRRDLGVQQARPGGRLRRARAMFTPCVSRIGILCRQP